MIYILTHRNIPFEVFTDKISVDHWCSEHNIDYNDYGGKFRLGEWDPYYYKPSTKKNSNNSTSDSSEEPEN